MGDRDTTGGGDKRKAQGDRGTTGGDKRKAHTNRLQKKVAFVRIFINTLNFEQEEKCTPFNQEKIISCP